MDSAEIRLLSTTTEFKEAVKVIRESFHTVADAFGLNETNCPTHPSFMTLERLKMLQQKGGLLYGLFAALNQIGNVALEPGGGKLYYLERLAVLPPYRCCGHGGTLLEFALRETKSRGGEKVSIGIIDADTRLKEWYTRRGFKKTGTRRFDHLPFNVCFMDIVLDCRYRADRN